MSYYWPISAARSSRNAVPGSSTWVASQLHAANRDVLAGTEEVHDLFVEGINEINQFMKTVLTGDKTVIAELLETENTAEADSPQKRRDLKRKLKVLFARNIEITADPESPTTESNPGIDQPKQHLPVASVQSEAPSPDGSFQKIQLSIRREPEKLPVQSFKETKQPQEEKHRGPDVAKIPSISDGRPKNLSSFAVVSVTPAATKTVVMKDTLPEKSPVFSKTPAPAKTPVVSELTRMTKTPAKTPRKSSNFVSLPPREPLTISSTIVQPNSVKKADNPHTSPIRRNRFPSMVESNSSGTHKSLIPPIKNNFEISPKITNSQSLSPSINPVGSIIKRSRNVFFDRMSNVERQPTEKPSSSSASAVYSSAETSIYKISPVRRILSSSTKTPNRRAASRSSIASSETSKATSRSPTRYDTKHSKNSSVTSTRDEDPEDFLVDSKARSTSSRFMSPTKSSNAKTSKAPVKLDETTKNRFLTTTLNPEVTKLSKYNGPSVKPKLVEERSKPDTVIAPSKKKSLMAQRSEAAALQPKKKIIISMNHKEPKLSAAGTNVPTLTPTVITKSIEKPPSLVETKRRPLAGNAVALPEAARPSYRVKSALKRTAIPDTEASPISFTDNILPNDELPDINTDDEDNASSKILKPWAQSPELHRLVLRNRDVDPKSVFGEIPPFKIEEIFESEASRLRGAPSPMKPIRGSEAKRFKSSYM